MTHRTLAAVIVASLLLAGCASSPGGPGEPGSPRVKIVTSRSALGANAVLVDVHRFRIDKSDRKEMYPIARRYAANLGATMALVRITDEEGPQLVFAVSAYRQR